MIVFDASTAGGDLRVTIRQGSPGLYSVRVTSGGRETGASCNHGLASALREAARIVADASAYNGRTLYGRERAQ